MGISSCDLNWQRISKNDSMIQIIGAIDELNSYLGLIKAMLSKEEIRQSDCQFIEEIQKNLMKLMSHVSDNKNEKLFFTQDIVVSLENEVIRLSENIPRLTGFVLPGKSIIEAQIQVGRTITRRAERYFAAAVNEERKLCPNAGEYLNKLSDYLFILSQQDY